MLRHPTKQPQILNIDKPKKQQHYLAKSTSVSTILHGGMDPNPSTNHFIDSLQRFKKDFASYDKEERQKQRQRKLKILEQRKNQQIQRQSRIRRNQFQYDQKNMDKINQSRYLCEIGLKKTGFSNGLPMNPITLKYHQNPFGSQQQFTDQQMKLRRMVRAHYIQNASTCGYNPVNGSNLPSLDPLIPKNTQGRFEQKLGQFYQTRRLDPNVDLQLNPKQVLPKHVGQVQRGSSSPIKSHTWQDDQAQFQSSYKTHFNQRPHQQMTNSRLQQSNLYRQYLPQIGPIGGASMYMPIQNLGNAIQKHYTVQQQNTMQQNYQPNNENMNPMNPYMQDSAYQNQMYDMRR